MIIETLRFVLSQPKWLKELCTSINKSISESQLKSCRSRPKIEAELSSIEKELKNLAAYIAQGHPSETIAESIDTKEQRRRLLEAELRKVMLLTTQKRVDTVVLVPYVERFLEKLKDFPRTIRPQLEALFPNGITLTPLDPTYREGVWQAEAGIAGSQIIFGQYNVAMGGIPTNPKTVESAVVPSWFDKGSSARAIWAKMVHTGDRTTLIGIGSLVLWIHDQRLTYIQCMRRML